MGRKGRKNKRQRKRERKMKQTSWIEKMQNAIDPPTKPKSNLVSVKELWKERNQQQKKEDKPMSYSNSYTNSSSKTDLGVKMKIDPIVYAKVMHWINKAGSDEVSGLGSVIVDAESNTIRVVDAILLTQENAGSSTDIDPAAVGSAMYRHHRDNKPGELKWWWHSHVNMGVFWSGTDMETIKLISDGGWFCATVLNQKHEMRSAYRQVEPVTLFVDNVETSLEVSVPQEVRDEWDKDYDDKVEKKTFSWDKGNGSKEQGDWSNNKGEQQNKYGFNIDDLIGAYNRDKITKEELVHYAELLDEEVHFIDDPDGNEEVVVAVDDDNQDVLTDEEATAMDLENFGGTINDDGKVLI